MVWLKQVRKRIFRIRRPRVIDNEPGPEHNTPGPRRRKRVRRHDRVIFFLSPARSVVRFSGAEGETPADHIQCRPVSARGSVAAITSRSGAKRVPEERV